MENEKIKSRKVLLASLCSIILSIAYSCKHNSTEVVEVQQSMPLENIQTPSYPDTTWIYSLPVDSLHREMFDDFIKEKSIISSNGKEYNYTKYLFFQDNLTKGSFWENFSIKCYEYGDSAFCYLAAIPAHQLIICTPKNIRIINISRYADEYLYRLGQKSYDIDSLRKFVELTKDAPLAKYERTSTTEGVAMSMRDSLWQTNFKVSYDEKGVKFTNTDGNGYTFRFDPPVQGRKRNNVKKWRKKLPPFLIYDFETYCWLFWNRLMETPYKIDFKPYFE